MSTDARGAFEGKAEFSYPRFDRDVSPGREFPTKGLKAYRHKMIR